MTSRSAILPIALLLSIAFPPARAQVGPVAIALMQDDAGIVLGQPLVVVEHIDSVRPLVNGASITHRTEERKWRDSEGRYRRQSAQLSDGADPAFHTATIIDPVANTLAILRLDEKRAIVYHLPDSGPEKLHPWVNSLDDTPPALPGVQVKVQKLPGKQIAGVYAEGRRVTRIRPPGTVDNDKTIVSVTERWVSPDLKIMLYTSTDDPREKQTREVTKLDRSEPDPTLFQVPSDFAIKDVPVHAPGADRSSN